MTDMDDEFRSLIRRVRGGSEEAAWELVREYGEAIRRAVRRALHVSLRPKFDSLDFVQIVWKSFFRARTIDRFESPQDLAYSDRRGPEQGPHGDPPADVRPSRHSPRTRG